MAKKKSKTLSQMEASLIEACQYTNVSVGGYKTLVAEMKKKYKSLTERLGKVGLPSEPIQYSSGGRAFLRDLRDHQDEFTVMGAVRDFLLGYWVSHKIGYRISKETVSFIEKTFKVEQLNDAFCPIIDAVCKEPVYIEADYNGGKISAFIGIGPFIQDVLMFDDQKVNCMISFLIGDEMDEQAYIRLLSSLPSDSVKQQLCNIGEYKGIVDERCRTPTYDLMLKIIVYIGYVTMRKGCAGKVIVEDLSKAYKCFKVQPIPYKDSLPNLSVSGGWISAGLCHRFGYLDRNQMRAEFAADIDGKIERSHVFCSFAPNRVNEDEAALFMKLMVLDWESEKTVYQFTTETSQKIWDKYIVEVCLNGISDELMRFMPYQTVVLSNIDSGQVALVAQCKIQKQNGSIRNGMFIWNIGNNGITVYLLEADRPVPMAAHYATSGDYDINSKLSIISILAHILVVMKKKWMKQQLKCSVKPTTTDNASLVPVVRNEETSQNESSELLFQSYVIEDEPLRLLDITPRTVKAVAYQKAVERLGRKMRPHVRRAHPHRYWMGHGKDKHMVVRYLERIRINCRDDKQQPTTIHEVR